MNKEWIDIKNNENKEAAAKLKECIIKAIDEFSYFDEKLRKRCYDIIKNIETNSYYNPSLECMLIMYDMIDISNEATTAFKEWEKSLRSDIKTYQHLLHTDYDRYLDSEPMEFDGDIIITDPCYIIKKDSDNDWRKCAYGDNMQILGINHYMTRDTLYGDWSCTTYNTDTRESIGSFCADAGLVSVFLLDEVLKYNPNFDYHINKPWTTTLIKDFKGTVQFVVKHEEGIYEDTTEWHTKGEKWEDYSVEVVGHGINKVTGEPINFVGTQTGL